MLNKKEYTSLFFYLAFLTGFFLTLEISYFIQCNKDYFLYFNFVSANLHLPVKIIPGILFFIVAQLFIHLSYCFVIWLTTLCVANFLQIKNITNLGIGLWLLGVITILVANYYYFPNSKFADIIYPYLFNPFVTKIVLLFLFSVCMLVLIIALLGACKIIYRKTITYIISAFSIFLFISFHYVYMQPPRVYLSSNKSPNIFIIGIDSLRPDFLGFFGHDIETPHLDSFLNDSIVFDEAVTPIARTFPSWNGILTGQYPRETGIRTNLAQQVDISGMATLPRILKQHHYETIYATDETRFSNIDKIYGFDHIITPPMGLNDFLLGSFNDFPLSNFIINTWLGKWLFPHSYANRPVFFTYQPDSFLNLIRPTITAQHNKPLFFAIHFCLPHYPYLWADLSGREFNIKERYVESIKRADKQVNDFLSLLNTYHLLDNAIVVMLSDHGEALEFSGDRITEKDLFLSKTTIPKFYPPNLDNEAINQSAGHGTDVLGLTQYHTLLAFKYYGRKLTPKIVTGVVSLLDIKPTLLQLLNLPDSTSSGHSLADNMIDSKSIKNINRHIFIESDFSPEAIRTVYPEAKQVLLEGVQLFQVKPDSTELIVKSDMNRMIIKSKQYADIYGEWMLALYPQNSSWRMPILINLRTGRWTNDLQSNFSKNSPAHLMLEKLSFFFGDEINPHQVLVKK